MRKRGNRDGRRAEVPELWERFYPNVSHYPAKILQQCVSEQIQHSERALWSASEHLPGVWGQSRANGRTGAMAAVLQRPVPREVPSSEGSGAAGTAGASEIDLPKLREGI